MATGKPAAVLGDQVVGVDTHVILVPSPGGPVPTPTPLPFTGKLAEKLSKTITINGKALALVGSVADNTPAHVPVGGSFQTPPSNKASILTGSATVMAENKPIARAGDTANTCNDPTDEAAGRVVATAKVLVG